MGLTTLGARNGRNLRRQGAARRRPRAPRGPMQTKSNGPSPKRRPNRASRDRKSNEELGILPPRRCACPGAWRPREPSRVADARTADPQRSASHSTHDHSRAPQSARVAHTHRRTHRAISAASPAPECARAWGCEAGERGRARGARTAQGAAAARAQSHLPLPSSGAPVAPAPPARKTGHARPAPPRRRQKPPHPRCRFRHHMTKQQPPDLPAPSPTPPAFATPVCSIAFAADAF